MKYEITYRNVVTSQESMREVEADNINEAAKIAKKYGGADEKIAKITPLWGSIFEDILGNFQTGFGGLFK